MASYMTSSTLIDSIKNRALIPTNQVTFQPDDFLRFANEEMVMGIIPMIMTYHQEYLLYREVTPLVDNTTSYIIPYRAIGNMLRDLSLVDSNGNYFKMTRANPDEIQLYTGSLYSSNNRPYYIINNTINLLPLLKTAPVNTSLLFTYPIRPNQLVDESRVATVQSVKSTSPFSVVNTSFDVSTSQITITNHLLANNVIVTLAPQTGGTLPSPFIQYQSYYVIVVNANTIQLSVTPSGSAITIVDQGTAGTIIATPQTQDILCTATIPSNIVTDGMLDLIQKNSPHKIYKYDIIPVSISGNLIRLNNSAFISGIPEDTMPLPIQPGDLVSSPSETSVPQIPDELHSILAQRVACRCLEALGDRDGLGAANQKLAEMEKVVGSMLQDRVEGTPQKVFNAYGPLRANIINRRSTRF